MPILLCFIIFFNCLFSFSFKGLLLNVIFTARDIILQSEWKLWQKVRGASVCAQGKGVSSESAANSNITGTKCGGHMGILFKSKNSEITAKHSSQYYISIDLSF